MDVPKEKKIYTTVYDNFKGVDYTSDPTYIYKRRTPSGVNMMPSLDGMPRKRSGWQIRYSSSDFIEASGSSETFFEVNRLHYFDLAGYEHIMVFSNLGLFVIRTYNDEETLTFLSDNETLKQSYDRAYFFDANGETAFYMYGDYKVWKYHYDEDAHEFKLEEVAPTVPTLRYSVSADGLYGEINESYNLLTHIVAEQFKDNVVPYIYSRESSLGTVTVDSALFLAMITAVGTHKFIFDGTVWVDKFSNLTYELSAIGITLPTGASPVSGSTVTIVVKGHYYTYLQREVAVDQASEVKAHKLDRSNTPITIITTGTPSSGEALLETVTENGKQRTRLRYSEAILPIIDGEDALYVSYPYTSLTYTSHHFDTMTDSQTYNVPTDEHLNRQWATGQISYRKDNKTATCKCQIDVIKEYDEGGLVHSFKVIATFLSNVAGFAASVTPTVSIPDAIRRKYPNAVFYFRGSGIAETSSEFLRLELNCYLSSDYSPSQGWGERLDVGKITDFTFNFKYVVQGVTKTAKVLLKAEHDKAMPSPSFMLHTSDAVPAIGSDGRPVINLQYYNYETRAWDKVSTANVSITPYRDGFFVNDKDVPAKYIDDVTSPYTTIQAKLDYVTAEGILEPASDAFYKTARNTSYTNGLANIMFVGGSSAELYSSRVWYSYFNDPLYFPDNNYLEVGSNDTKIMGLVKVGEYLGIVKQGKTTDTSIFITYPTTFEKNATYAVKPSVNGIGACSRYAFNVLGSETLFLSDEGVMAISFTETDVDKKVKNRSYYVDGKLLKEPKELLERAYSFVWKGFYILALGNGHVYLLDGNQRNSWGNDKTNLVYECYYWENVPAKCFAKAGNRLWFTDGSNLCTFEEGMYNDNGEAIACEWSTLADDDGSVQYYKSLQKKGCLVSVMPVGQTSAEIYVKKDSEPEVFIKSADTTAEEVPAEIYLKKKIKKYKRLQIIVRNNVLNQPFAVDRIVKMYTLGNYSKK